MPATRLCLPAIFLVPLCVLTACWADDPLPAPDEQTRGVPVIGRVWLAGKDLTNTQINVYRDAAQKQFVAAFGSGGPSGYFALSLDPGEYYLTAFSDQDANKRATPGDGIGFYGVTDLRSRPQPLRVDPGSAAITMSIYIVLQIGEDGKSLVPVAARPLVPYAAEEESEVSGTVAGRFSPDSACFVMLIPVSTRIPPRAAICAPDGSFKLSALPGNYFLLAVENFNDTPAVDTGDFVAVAGYEEAMGPSMPTVQVPEGKALADQRLSLDWALAQDGRLRSGDGMTLGARLNAGDIPAILSGRVLGVGEPMPGARVEVFADETLTELHYRATADDAGRFCVGVRPGTYYVMATLDRDGNSVGSAGDDIGYLRADEETARPTAQTLAPGQLALDADIPLTLTINPDRTTRPIGTEEPVAE